MSYFVIDIESDAPIPGTDHTKNQGSMISFACIRLDKQLETYFDSGLIRPISEYYEQKRLNICGVSRSECLKGKNPVNVMKKFNSWVLEKNLKGRPKLISDNPTFDGMFTFHYLHSYAGANALGHSGQRIGDLFTGYTHDPYYDWRKHVITPHDHNPLNDVKGNAEALLHLITMGYKLHT